MRGVAGKEHAVVPIALERQRVRLVDGDPDRRPCAALAHHVEQALYARHHVLRLHGFVGVLAVAQLVVDALHVVGLLVNEDGRARIGRGIEVRETLGRPVAFELDIDDHVAAFVARSLQSAGPAPRGSRCGRRRTRPPSRTEVHSRLRESRA